MSPTFPVSETPLSFSNNNNNNNEYLCNAEFKQSSNAPQLYYQAGVIRQQFSQRTERQRHTQTDATYDVQKQVHHHTTQSSRTGTINWQQRRRQQNKWTARFFKASASTKTHPVPRRWSEIANAWQSHRYRHFTRIHTCATEHMPFLGRILVTGFSFQTLNVNRGTKKDCTRFYFLDDCQIVFYFDNSGRQVPQWICDITTKFPTSPDRRPCKNDSLLIIAVT